MGLLLLFVLPLVELYLLVKLGGAIGAFNTLLYVVVTAVAGMSAARAEGFRLLSRWRAAMQQGRVPEEGPLGQLLVVLGGVLLVLPGPLTDLAGLALLVPPSRRFVMGKLRHHLTVRMKGQVVVDGREVLRTRQEAQVSDAEIVEDAPRRAPLLPPSEDAPK